MGAVWPIIGAGVVVVGAFVPFGRAGFGEVVSVGAIIAGAAVVVAAVLGAFVPFGNSGFGDVVWLGAIMDGVAVVVADVLGAFVPFGRAGLGEVVSPGAMVEGAGDVVDCARAMPGNESAAKKPMICGVDVSLIM